jgi:hypothetical protein
MKMYPSTRESRLLIKELSRDNRKGVFGVFPERTPENGDSSQRQHHHDPSNCGATEECPGRYQVEIAD